MISTAIPVHASNLENANTERLAKVEIELSPNAVQPRSMYDLSLSDELTYGSKRVKATFVVSVRDEVHNTSGFYITGVKSVKIENVAGWHSVARTGIVGNVTYVSNHQKATVSVTYEASTGEGLEPYSGTAHLSLL